MKKLVYRDNIVFFEPSIKVEGLFIRYFNTLVKCSKYLFYLSNFSTGVLLIWRYKSKISILLCTYFR